MNRHPTDPNKGMNVKSYGEIVGAAVLVLLLAILAFVWVSRGKVLRTVDNPNPTHSASPQ